MPVTPRSPRGPAVRLVAGGRPEGPVLALPVAAGAGADPAPELLPTVAAVPAELHADCTALLAQDRGGRAGRGDPGRAERAGGRLPAGQVRSLPRPRERGRVLLAGVGDGGEAGWRAAGAALARTADREPALTVAMPAEAAPDAVRGLVEGLLLGSYRYRLGAGPAGGSPRLRRVAVAVADPERYHEAQVAGEAVAEATTFARDLTNTPSLTKTPAWFVRQVEKEAGRLDLPPPGLALRTWDEAALRADGFRALLAVGGGSARPPRLLQVGYRPPRGARAHVVLVGKGITFDTGGVSLKRGDAMKLMRKDMGGAAAVVAAVLGAARLRLPVRVTALAPLAENLLSGSAQRPGDVVRHWDGTTSEVHNTDAEGRLVLADALGYAAARLRPDALVDLATLTGAVAVALGRRTGALYSDNTDLADGLTAAATAAGERVWRMPLVTDYREALRSDLADLTNSPDIGASSVLAALYLREFAGAARNQWAHIDMSAPAWSDQDDGELSRGATGWGVRTLLRWLATGW